MCFALNRSYLCWNLSNKKKRISSRNIFHLTLKHKYNHVLVHAIVCTAFLERVLCVKLLGDLLNECMYSFASFWHILFWLFQSLLLWLLYSHCMASTKRRKGIFYVLKGKKIDCLIQLRDCSSLLCSFCWFYIIHRLRASLSYSPILFTKQLPWAG